MRLRGRRLGNWGRPDAGVGSVHETGREMQMNRDSGSKDFPIWLIGDSSPVRWEENLVDPLDSRHPARHNIWTPVLEGIQTRLYAASGERLRTDGLYVRNAVHDASAKPRGNASEWSTGLAVETRELSRLFEVHAPKLVFSFGAFAFEFTRRARGECRGRAFRHWSTKRLGEEFRGRLDAFTPIEVNLVPLLHASIARGHFLRSHQNFTQMEDGNYFDYVAHRIADCLRGNRTVFPIG